MRCEVPILLRCCFCFPLRYGLIVWAYIKQVLSLLFLAFIVMIFSSDYRRMSIWGCLVLSGIIMLTVVDFVFHAFFIISAHRKDYRKIRIFYRYSIFLFCVCSIILILYTGSTFLYLLYVPLYVTMFWFYFLLPAVGMTLALLISQAYLLVLVRSEFIKLKNNSQFEFVNNETEEKCTANIDYEERLPA